MSKETNVPKEITLYGVTLTADELEKVPTDTQAKYEAIITGLANDVKEAQGTLVEGAVIIDDFIHLIPEDIRTKMASDKAPNIMQLGMSLMSSGIVDKVKAMFTNGGLGTFYTKIYSKYGNAIETARAKRATERAEQAKRDNIAAAFGE